MNNLLQKFFKRQMDFWGSLVALLMLLPLFLVVAVFIKLDSSGSVFFRQERIGKGGRSFRPFKFRTMIEGAMERGLKHRLAEHDERITRAGKILRRFGIDELPQLINVLSGEMSLVGPRPTLRYQVERYNDFQKKRLFVKPGITGLAMIHGRNLLSWEERIAYDIWYLEHWSIWLDIRILFLTPYEIFFGKGAYGKGGANDPFVEVDDE